jgi:biuret amidohydrolase
MTNQRALDATKGFDWRGYLDAVPTFVPQFSLAPDRTALLIVDMQRSSADRNAGQGQWLQREYPTIAAYYYQRVEDLVIPNISRLQAAFRQRGSRVVFLTVGPQTLDGADFNPLRRKREEELLRDPDQMAIICGGPQSLERAIPPQISPHPGDIVLNKLTRGAFTSTGLDLVLRNMGVDGLIVTGVVTNGCVWATVSDAADLGYKCVLVDDACAAFTRMFHDTALFHFGASCGKVLQTSQAIDLLGASIERNRAAATR